ncbi:MAG: GNAT family N-acetyltransferase [Janthinobacterium lividum]
MIRFSTERLTLRTPVEDDLTAYLAYRNDPAALAVQHLGPATINEARTFLLDQAMRTESAPGWLMLAIVDKCAGRMLGETGVFRSPEQPDHGNIGWWLHPEFQGRGFATEAARGLLHWCFGSLKLERVDAGCLVANTRSLRLMDRLGLRRNPGPGTREVDGILHDEATFAISREEWVDVHDESQAAEVVSGGGS